MVFDDEAEAGGFRRLKKRGVWHDPEAEPLYYSYRTVVDAEAVLEDGVILDEATGVYWNWRTADVSSENQARRQGYRDTPGAYRGYVAQKFGDKAYIGFKPDWFNKSGYFELYSAILEAKGFAPLPNYVPIPEHHAKNPDELILTTFRINVQMLSRTQNRMWLDEISIDNAAWINPETAAAKGIVDSDRIKIKSLLGEIEAVAKMTENVVPEAITMSSHGGRWEYGRYASGEKAPYGIDVDSPYEELKWWPADGGHPNRIIPNSSEPISGQQR